MPTYNAWQVTGHRQFEWVQRELVEPAPGQVRIRVRACGVCHSDMVAAEGSLRDSSVPLVPGHEIVGVVDAVGEGVRRFQLGDRVGVGYLGGHCHECEPCRRGDFVNCEDQPQHGSTTDGGYAEYVYARASGVVAIPDGLDDIEAAPLLCAGLTVYNALLDTQAPPRSLVAIQGLGGLGHLAVQYAKALGYQTAVVARGTEKSSLASKFGADHYIDSNVEDPGEALQKLGGAAAIVATAASGASMSSLPAGLAARGRLVVVGVGLDPISVSTVDLVFGGRTITGTLTGSAIENEDNLKFSLSAGVEPMTEVMPIDQAPAAYERMMAGEARLRIVLTVS
ncbi:alcohol dehydrogenase [Mycobacterium intermedium]|uniref:Alcohol dehydrogenase n=1 Tax=Mycobacterium intermedium TaxID=28445 RepID=A0A1E3S534_MYCIE|nr:alcohol dehydrogenase catalytic domain-containing protein [Mycobacterium intermedium]MCV6966900.1 alcohol dehydrogenase catalytic domain-containing protein [Mycobacterium intermedium]ODQ97266.1 alcohol dehydrogenase [Mycobacterium intermedium]OPE47409.1 alcohol dehydrogenase [Mycobacterium intermedium]ORA96438.1 alcohol dehydrogenase [Mycobacterium intermedium]